MDENTLFTMNTVCFSYGESRAIRDLSLDLEPGRFYGIVGPNGCGKTTLLDILVRNRRPEKGTVGYKGQDLRTYSRRALAREISLVPQDFQINFPFTVREVVLMGRHPHIPRFAAPSGRDLDMVHEIMVRMEIDRFMDKHITELSGGEKQRVVFARAFAQDTTVLVLDEGTSNMDIRYTLKILDMAAKRVREKRVTVIAAMHNLNLASGFCDHIIFMKEGTVVTAGPVDDVLNKENIQEVFEVDARVYHDPFSGSKQIAYRKEVAQ